MKKIYFLLLQSMLFSMSWANDINIKGTYVNDYGKVVITDSMFYFVASDVNVWENDTLATCTWKKVEENLILVESVDPYKQISVVVDKRNEETVSSDSIKISFDLGQEQKYMKVEVFNEVCNSFKSNTYDVQVPKSTKLITFAIEPNRGTIDHTSLGEYYGLKYFLSPEIEIDNNFNTVSVSVLNLSLSFFEHYYIRGDYVYIKDGVLHWKGKEYHLKAGKQ